MASRLMHLAVAEMILAREKVNDPNRFRLGCILPDAKIDSALRAAPHFQRRLSNGLVTCGLKKYLELFGDRVWQDELYLGYYLHLVQDMVYRRYMYAIPFWDARVPDNIRRLHSDYRKLNRYIVESRGLENTITTPTEFEKEAINLMFDFDAEGFLQELQNDFESVQEGEYNIFTPQMAEDFFAIAAETCFRELEALHDGLPIYDEEAMAWGRE